MSTVFSWHDKRKYFIFFITEIEIYLQSKNSTDYSVQIYNYFIINVNLIIPIIIFLLSQLLLFDDYFTSKEHETFPFAIDFRT